MKMSGGGSHSDANKILQRHAIERWSVSFERRMIKAVFSNHIGTISQTDFFLLKKGLYWKMKTLVNDANLIIFFSFNALMLGILFPFLYNTTHVLIKSKLSDKVLWINLTNQRGSIGNCWNVDASSNFSRFFVNMFYTTSGLS